MTQKKISGPDEFQEIVERHCNKGWEDKLHFDLVLVENFGMSKEASTKLRETKIEVEDKDAKVQVTLEHHALRWLTKAFKGYGPVGCLTDVVNLVYAMLNLEQPDKADETEVIKVVKQMQGFLDKSDFSTLWVPTHLAHDAESDDSLSWLLLEHIHKTMETKLEVLIQLPKDDKLKDVHAFLEAHSQASKQVTVQVYADPDSSNGKAVGSTWNQLAAAAKPPEAKPEAETKK